MNGIRKNIADLLEAVRKNTPLIHHITNYVTVNDVANVTLAIGASPIMADAIEEAVDIASMSSALVLNIGTLNRRTVESMIAAGKRANALEIPVVLDPVGAGASHLRNTETNRIAQEVQIAILRGNLSEISFVAGLSATTKGVDASLGDAKNDSVYVAQAAAKKLGCTAAVTGAVDVISDGVHTIKIENGHPMLARVTGTGCMASALAGAFAGACKGDYLTAAAAAVSAMGIAGEMAYAKAGNVGTASFRTARIDALSTLGAQEFAQRSKIDEV